MAKKGNQLSHIVIWGTNNTHTYIQTHTFTRAVCSALEICFYFSFIIMTIHGWMGCWVSQSFSQWWVKIVISHFLPCNFECVNVNECVIFIRMCFFVVVTVTIGLFGVVGKRVFLFIDIFVVVFLWHVVFPLDSSFRNNVWIVVAVVSKCSGNVANE